MPAQRQENPGWRRSYRQAGRPLGSQPIGAKTVRGHPGQGFKIISFAGEYRNGYGVKYFCPAAPLRHLRQIVRAHQPHELGGREALL